MIIVAIDIETTGLKPRVHGITEFAAVLFDTETNEPARAFYKWLDPEDYVWSRFCLNLHKFWIDRVCNRIDKRQLEATLDEPEIVANVDDLGAMFKKWLSNNGLQAPLGKRLSITATGKNFGAFDLQFLLAKGFPDIFRHRVFEWVNYFHKKTDEVPPDLKTCKERAVAGGYTWLRTEVAHNALDDALDVMRLIRYTNGIMVD